VAESLVDLWAVALVGFLTLVDDQYLEAFSGKGVSGQKSARTGTHYHHVI
jgi:hypothetical protein